MYFKKLKVKYKDGRPNRVTAATDTPGGASMSFSMVTAFEEKAIDHHLDEVWDHIKENYGIDREAVIVGYSETKNSDGEAIAKIEFQEDFEFVMVGKISLPFMLMPDKMMNTLKKVEKAVIETAYERFSADSETMSNQLELFGASDDEVGENSERGVEFFESDNGKRNSIGKFDDTEEFTKSANEFLKSVAGE